MTPGSPHELTRRSALRLCTPGGAAALIAACSGLAPTAAPSQPTAAAINQPRNEGKLQALINQNSGNYIGAAFNTKQAPTDNKLVRQALQFALHRQQISDVVFRGSRSRSRCSGFQPRPHTTRPRTRPTPSIWTKHAHSLRSRAPATSRSISIIPRSRQTSGASAKSGSRTWTRSGSK
jgi:ABC-type transport system substrate-binding protein